MFETGIGGELVRTESDLLITILLRLLQEGIVALPLHDAVLCAASRVETVARAMGEESERFLGFRLPVRVSISDLTC
jgi:hypothetical protein